MKYFQLAAFFDQKQRCKVESKGPKERLWCPSDCCAAQNERKLPKQI
jgi:hypothetical protein